MLPTSRKICLAYRYAENACTTYVPRQYEGRDEVAEDAQECQSGLEDPGDPELDGVAEVVALAVDLGADDARVVREDERVVLRSEAEGHVHVVELHPPVLQRLAPQLADHREPSVRTCPLSRFGKFSREHFASGYFLLVLIFFFSRGSLALSLAAPLLVLLDPGIKPVR